jgi:hypothetical protein
MRTTREEWAKLLPIIQAYIEGKIIEYRSIDGCWYPDYAPNFMPSFLGEMRHRIKLEDVGVTK